jgi:transcriptional regulator with XRE-family HTH domain
MEQHTTQQALARNLRRLRVARRWSLADLAGATGVGKATVSAIENARANPTVDTLAALAAALEVDAAALLEQAPEDDLTVVRAGRGTAAGDGFERIGRLADGSSELLRAAFEPRTQVEAPPRAPGTRAHVVVTRGTLVVGPAERPTELGRGDYAAFPVDRDHVFSTAARGAEAVVVVERRV